MQSDTNKICLSLKEEMMFPVNTVIGINGMMEPNIIAFEHALGQIQNKLSLPEYNGPDNFEAQEEYDIRKVVDGILRNEHKTLTCPQSFTQHFMFSNSDKEQALRENRNYRLINMTNVEKKKKLRSNLKIYNSISMKVTPEYIAMKQMTLDRYSFQSNLLTFKNSSSIMIKGSSNKSVDSKSYSQHKMLVMRNSNNLQHFESNCSLLHSNLYSKTLSYWTKTTKPLKNDQGSLATESCLTNKNGCGIETSFNDPIDKDSLDMDIDNAMKLFEVDSSPILSYKETGVQTTPPMVHACNCLGYHNCEAFKDLASKRCAVSRSIAALDLDTLHHLKNSTSQSEIFDPNVPQMKKFRKTSETFADELLSVNNKVLITNSNSSSSIAPETREITASLEKKVDEENAKQENAQTVNFIKNDNLNTDSLETWNRSHASLHVCTENGSTRELKNFYEMIPHARKVDCGTELYQPKGSFNQNCLPSKYTDKMCNSNKENAYSIKIKSGAKCTNFVSFNENKDCDISDSEEQNPDTDNHLHIPQANDSNTETGTSVPTDASLWSHVFQWRDLPRVTETVAQRPYEDFLTLKPATQKLRRIGLSKKDKTTSLHPKKIQN
ncbi:hypothetical protein R5R35_004267 [Gryllus longicercus]|uniref:Uncharacterized protein n=2 Tax=Gryllus longicercus TaxID=2509291 RepID=A0AAN9WPQ9_9ORTH